MKKILDNREPPRRTTAWSWISITTAAVLSIACAIGVRDVWPDATVSADLRVAARALKEGDNPAAETYAQRVLARYPKAAVARGLIACALLSQDQASLAGAELYQAVADGFFLDRQGYCGAGSNLRDKFQVISLAQESNAGGDGFLLGNPKTILLVYTGSPDLISTRQAQTS
jgi:hypothetical protein